MSGVKEVARIAGVSTATVSRAINNPEKVAEKTLKKVIAAVSDAGYSVNHLARNLRTSKTSNVVVLVPNITNPFYSEVIRGMERVAHTYGYSVLLGDTQDSEDREAVYASMLTTKRADGLITLCPRIPQLSKQMTSDELLNAPIVNACECARDTVMRTVKIDNIAAAKEATEHLLNLGHRRIGLVAGPFESPLSIERLNGYSMALKTAGIAYDDTLVASGDFSIESGKTAAEKILSIENRPTAIFCSNDEMALGVMTALKSNGAKIPDDISIIGFDDIHYAQYFDPPLTTIAQPAGDLGELAMSQLCEILAGNPPQSRNAVLPHKLIERESTKPYKPAK